MGELEATAVEATERRKRRRAVSTAELFAALEGPLPFTAVEFDCLADHIETYPNDPDHDEDSERLRQGQQALGLAKQLIARKTGYVRRLKSKLQTNGTSNGE